MASLFSGIGGFELAFGSAGYETVLACEVDSAARAVLNDRFPNVDVYGDIRTLPSLPEGVDIITAGFPCQDLSSVGPKVGMAGKKSSLVKHVFRLLEQRTIEWVVFENVFFMLHLNQGKAMESIVSRLEKLGYKWAYRVLDPTDFGIPQRRRRVYLVGSLHHDPRRALLIGGKAKRAPVSSTLTSPIGFYWTEGAYASGLTHNAIPPLKSGSTIGIPSPPAILMPDGVPGTPQISDAERLQGFPVGWTEAASEQHRATIRWRLVGNAITVPVARWLASNISTGGMPYVELDDAPLQRSDRWPLAAYNVGEGRRISTAAGNGHFEPMVGIGRFLRFSVKPLSRKAALGFLSRARKGSLRYPDGFLPAIEKYAANLEG